MSRLARHKLWIAAAALVISTGAATADPLITKAQIAEAVPKIEACLLKQSQNNAKAENCIGNIKGACDDAISAGGEAAHATCSDNETAVWDALLNKIWAEMPDALRPKRFADLKRVQKLWLAYRDAKCDFVNDIQSLDMWNLMRSADCRMDETARRAIELREILLSVP